MRYVVVSLMLICALAGTACAQGAPTRIGYYSRFEISNLTFAVEDDGGQIVWIDPQTTDWGSRGFWTIDNDPDNRFLFDSNTPGRYKTYAIVGMEHEGNWAGYGMGTDNRAIKGVRLDLKSDYNPEELTYQLWTYGLGIDPVSVASFPTGLGTVHRELMFDGGNTIEWRVTSVTPPVPEPSTLAALASTLAGFGLFLKRKML